MFRLSLLIWKLWTNSPIRKEVQEVSVLLANRMRCPLTGVAARYTDDRSANFDIYLPVWLARHNKLIFGSLFVLDEMYLVSRWIAA